MTKWEYYEAEDLGIEELNALGREGWELVSRDVQRYDVTNERKGYTESFTDYFYIFKRPLTDT